MDPGDSMEGFLSLSPCTDCSSLSTLWSDGKGEPVGNWTTASSYINQALFPLQLDQGTKMRVSIWTFELLICPQSFRELNFTFGHWSCLELYSLAFFFIFCCFPHLHKTFPDGWVYIERNIQTRAMDTFHPSLEDVFKDNTLSCHTKMTTRNFGEEIHIGIVMCVAGDTCSVHLHTERL